MKKTRKLIPALAMLLISAVLMSTASYAWFSMNDEVTANGMQITAESNKTFLLISATGPADGDTTEAEHAAAIQSVPDSRVVNAVVPADTSVYPSAVVGLTTDVDPDLEDAVAPEDDDDLQFYYAIGEGYDDGDAKDNTAEIVSKDNTNYVLKYTFYITVAEGVAPASNIVVRSITFNGDAAVNAIVTTEYKAINFTGTSSTPSAPISGDLVINDETVLPVYVYVYYNGTHSTVTTANAANLAGNTINIVFGVQ